MRRDVFGNLTVMTKRCAGTARINPPRQFFPLIFSFFYAIMIAAKHIAARMGGFFIPPRIELKKKDETCQEYCKFGAAHAPRMIILSDWTVK
jgi:hypothetical protein